ncbi:hypothetical protein [Acidovorax sp. LjRoot194]|uniref:aggregation-promoting factor C-terminal-like domain-containing protein n=1 Tax=Acidovorax sp. LjRoot194 TaxID=3342280 RepID=UPI003ECD3AE9
MTHDHLHTHRPLKTARHKWKAKSPNIVSLHVQMALKEAMEKENIAVTDFDDLLWIMAQESGGVVGVRNGSSTARGLFQLLMAQYPLNPNGEKSFGNAVEECQGGIHYIYGRYHSSQKAKAFWEKHHWY